MEFGLNKCGTEAIHKRTSMDEAVHNLMDGNSLTLVGKDGYKYLGIFETSQSCNHTQEQQSSELKNTTSRK